MMAFFNGRKRSKILMVAILVLTLVATYAVPMTVFAESTQGIDGSRFIEGTSGGDSGIPPGGDDPADPGIGDLPDGDEPADPGTGDLPDGDGPSDPQNPPEGSGEDDGGINEDGDLEKELIEEDAGPEPQMMNLMMMPLLSEPEYGISLKKTASTETAFQGDIITYTIIVTNTGQDELKNVVLTDPLLGPWGFPWTKVVGNLEPGESKTYTEDYKIPSSYSGDTLINTASVMGTGQYYEKVKVGWFWVDVPRFKNVSASDSVEITVTPKPIYGISLEKTVSPTSALPGEEVIYSFTVTNTGQKELKNVTLTDPLFGGTWSHDFGNIAKDGTQTYTETHMIPVDATFPYDNEATVTGFGKSVPKDKLGQYVSWINENITEVPDWLLGLLGINKNEIVQATATATVTEKEEPNEPAYTYNYTVNYKLTGSGITVAPSATGTGITTAGSITIPAPAVDTKYRLISGSGAVTFTFNIETSSYEETVWYEEIPVTPGPNPGPNPRPDRDSDDTNDNTVALQEEQIPAGPIEGMDETVILDEEVPAGALPKTGGFSPLLLYGIGTMLAGSGIALKRRDKRN